MDLNGDGIVDILAGSYAGKITIYAGNSEGGFDAPEEVKQKTDYSLRENRYECLYTNTSFSDYNGDGLLDAFVGGVYGPRVMINVGTAKEPIFSERQHLREVDGSLISVFDERAEGKYINNEYHIYIRHIDWDNDGVKDLITSVSYMYEGSTPLMFHKGVKTDEGDRYEKPVSLIKSWSKEKLLPGKYLHIDILDYNGDGINDILLGVSLEFNAENNTIYEERMYDFMYSIPHQSRTDIYKIIREKYIGKKEDYSIAINTVGTFYKYIESKHKRTDNDRVRGYVLLIKGEK